MTHLIRCNEFSIEKRETGHTMLIFVVAIGSFKISR